jgi:hypothetical protein
MSQNPNETNNRTNKLDLKETLVGSFTMLFVWTLSILVETIFLIAWLVATAWLKSVEKASFVENTFDPDTFKLFQNIFKYSTLIPLLGFIIEDQIKILVFVINSVRSSIGKLKK